MDMVNDDGPEVVELFETLTAVVHAVVPMAAIASFFDRSFAELASVLGEQGIDPAGPAFARYAGPPGESADVEVGFPVEVVVTAQGAVRPSSLPAGRCARLVHAGGYDRLWSSWAQLGAWIAAQGLSPGSALWEIYVTEPKPDMDPAELRTELLWALR